MDDGPTRAVIYEIIFGLITFGLTCLYGCPHYSVYQQRLEGQAVLAHAQASREVAVAEAKAKMESASLLAEADTAFRWTKFSRHVWEWFKTHPRWKRIKERWPQAQEWETAIDLHGSKVA